MESKKTVLYYFKGRGRAEVIRVILCDHTNWVSSSKKKKNQYLNKINL